MYIVCALVEAVLMKYAGIAVVHMLDLGHQDKWFQTYNLNLEDYIDKSLFIRIKRE